MRKILVTAVTLALALSFAAPARGVAVNQWQNITFTSVAGCANACPYWLDNANQDLDGNGKEDVFFQSCSNPDGTADALADVPGAPYQNPAMYDDIVVGPAPTGSRLLEVELDPQVDWDGFICQWRTGDVAGAELAILANIVLENCNNVVGNDNPVPIACIETGSIEAVVNGRYIIRAYNFHDLPTMTGRYRFRSA